MQFVNSFIGCSKISPFHRLFCTKSCLVNLDRRRLRCYAAKKDSLNGKSIARTEYAPHVIKRAHIIKDNYKRKFIRLFELLKCEAPHFYGFKFSHKELI